MKILKVIKIVLKYIIFLVLFIRYNIFNKINRKEDKKEEANIVIFDVRSSGRFIPYLLKAILLKSDKIVVNRKISLSNTISLAYILRSNNRIKLSYYNDIKHLNNGHLITDNLVNQPVKLIKTIKIDYQYFQRSSYHENKIVMPFYMHPKIYKKNLYCNMDILKSCERRYNIFFAGSALISSYTDMFNFKMLDRNSIIKSIMMKYNDKIKIIYDRKSFIQRNNKEKIILIITNNSNNTLSKHIMSQKEYLEELAKSNFCLAPPGVKIPFSHNVIEAMALGVIPILNYSDYFEKPLIDMFNCITFNSLKELENKIKNIFVMEESTKRRMRLNVLDYYEKHLSPKSFSSKLINTDHDSTMYVCASNITGIE